MKRKPASVLVLNLVFVGMIFAPPLTQPCEHFQGQLAPSGARSASAPCRAACPHCGRSAPRFRAQVRSRAALRGTTTPWGVSTFPGTWDRPMSCLSCLRLCRWLPSLELNSSHQTPIGASADLAVWGGPCLFVFWALLLICLFVFSLRKAQGPNRAISPGTGWWRSFPHHVTLRGRPSLPRACKGRPGQWGSALCLGSVRAGAQVRNSRLLVGRLLGGARFPELSLPCSAPPSRPPGLSCSWAAPEAGFRSPDQRPPPRWNPPT